MNITISLEEAREPVAVMRLQGDIDASNFVQVVDKAREIYQNPARNLILDLSEVPNISTTGLNDGTSRPDSQQHSPQTCQTAQPTARGGQGARNGGSEAFFQSVLRSRKCTPVLLTWLSQNPSETLFVRYSARIFANSLNNSRVLA
jgi:hypothetical protein